MNYCIKITNKDLLLVFIFLGTLCVSCIFIICFLLQASKISSHNFINIFSVPFSLSSPFCTLIMWILVWFMLPQRSFQVYSFLNFVFLLLFWFCDLHYFVFQIIYAFLCISEPDINSFSKLFISVNVFLSLTYSFLYFLVPC